MARLSTHVLDVSCGLPASGMVIDLRDAHGRHLMTVSTNHDGRTNQPLLSGDNIPQGVYELTFHAGDYFRAQGVALPEPAFLDIVVIRFGIADGAGNYHVPLLLSPYSYSTYRGS
jgi:5-hydroxyisourate hydrolase